MRTAPILAELQRRSLPSGWRWAKMSDACSRVQDGTHFSPKEQTQTGDFKYITAKNIKHWGLDLTELTYVPERVHHEIYRRCNVEKGDVLYIKDGVTTGIATVNTLDEEFSLLSSVALLKPKRDILDSLFLKYYLNSPEGFRNMTGQMTGTAIKRLILQKIKAAAVPVAPLPEQRRIVAEIEKQFTRLEAGVAALRRVQANLKRYRAAVLKAACEGRLVPTEADLAKTGKRKSTFETGEALLARILTERRKNWQGRGKYKEPTAPDAGNLGSLPAAWAWVSFEQIAERVTVGFVGSMKHEYVEEGVPFLRSQNVRENRFDPEGLLHISQQFHQKLSKSSIQPGDLAVVRSGSVGVTCAIPKSLPEANCSDLVLIQRPLAFIPQYGAYYMNSLARRHVEAGKVGVALIHFNTKSVAALAVPLPPLAEQSRIVAEVERRLSVVEELEAVVSANLQRATRLRQSILQKAFTGELV